MSSHHRLVRHARHLLGLVSAVSLIGLAQAAQTDVSQTPLLTASGTPVKPNILFILDDSGSMNNDYLPEDAGFSSSKYGGYTSQCNGLAFNPTLAYEPPVNADGSSKANASTSDVMRGDVGLSSKRSVDPSNLSVVNTGSVTVTTSGGNYSVGDQVTLYDRNNTTSWMIGTVTSWTGWSKTLVVSVVAGNGSGAMSNAYVGSGWPPVVYYTYSGSEPVLGYSYSTSGSVNTSTNFYKQCNSSLDSNPGAAVFTRVVMKSNSANLQKYANWYQYYQTRMKMMKTVVSHAFKDIDDKFRVGYNTILNTNAKESAGNTNFLHVRDFDATQKSKFYAYLDGNKISGYTPLRGALSNAGRYFANKAPDQDLDPVQYSCQRNFSILATDGAWNTNNETGTYGPYKLDGSNVGQQDGSAARPMRDATNNTGSGGSTDSLADVAMYFYSADLRNASLGNCTGAMGVDVCEDNVSTLGIDIAKWQHMTTYTLSLGQNGTIKYDAKYDTQTSGDYFDIVQGTKNWPNPGTDAGKVDDLWHAAVNGRGRYFNAADPNAVTEGLKNALAAIAQISASGSAASTSTLRPVQGNNQVFIARYTSALWVGDVSAYKINTDTGAPIVRDDAGKDIADWSAAAKLQSRATARKIYYFKSGLGLRDFTYANLATDGFAGDFDAACTRATPLSQCPALAVADKTAANLGANLVNYLRGTELSYYRQRTQMLGDMVGSSPVYVRTPPLKYDDAGYAAFQAAQANRKGAVYVGANDGMLHAFDAATGEELWAYVPSMVRGNMYKLADNNYGSNHQYFVDGSPVAADVYIGGAWKTILVGGLGAGGKGYYALDITDPAAPKALWEFTDSNQGLSFARPLITKRANGEWVVVVTSGYNNVGDGKGHLFVLNAATGAKIADISTSAGDAGTPSGLGPANAWVEKTTDNTAKRFYAGDLQGNIWRFDVDGLLEPKYAALKLATVKLGGVPQPISTRPQLAEVDYLGAKVVVVYVGTGKMIGLTDMTSSDPQSIYGIKDDLGNTGLGDVRAGTTLVKQTLTTVGNVRTAGNNPVDWSLKNGWVVDLPDARERVNIDMLLQFNTLIAAGNVPQSVASCTAGGGYAWLYYLNIANGGNTGDRVATKIDDALVVGLSAFLLGNGKNGVIVNKSVKDPSSEILPTTATPALKGRRAAWRELVDR